MGVSRLLTKNMSILRLHKFDVQAFIEPFCYKIYKNSQVSLKIRNQKFNINLAKNF